MRYLIYCDESSDKGTFYSNFHGGALLRSDQRQAIEAALAAAKLRLGILGEAKWTKISAANEAAYAGFVDAIFALVRDGALKLRMMFTQNINQTRHLDHDEENAYFILYYYFIKDAFGLRYCNPDRQEPVELSVYLDDAPDSRAKLDNFKDYLSSLSTFPVFFREKIAIRKEEISEIRSHDHVILQAVDVVLGAMQFRLNEFHKRTDPITKRRGKRTRAKERVYKHINAHIRAIYPDFNIGISTGQATGPADRWHHAYRHWCFVPSGSIRDLNRGKRK